MRGDYKIMPVAQQHQGQVFKRLKWGDLQEVDAGAAEAVTGRSGLPHAFYYYLARVGYVGGAPHGTIPAGVSMSVDVDTDGVAYVSSFKLSKSNATSEMAVVLSSPTRLKRIVSTCGAAE